MHIAAHQGVQLTSLLAPRGNFAGQSHFLKWDWPALNVIHRIFIQSPSKFTDVSLFETSSMDTFWRVRLGLHNINNKISHLISPVEDKWPHNLIYRSIQSENQYISSAVGQLRPSADIKSPDSSGGSRWNLRMASWHGWNYREWQQTPRGGAGAWSHASKCCWTNPISSLAGFLPVTFPILTAADQNNTYLFMHASRNHMWETKVHSRKRRTDRHRAVHGDIEFLGSVRSSESCVL